MAERREWTSEEEGKEQNEDASSFPPRGGTSDHAGLGNTSYATERLAGSGSAAGGEGANIAASLYRHSGAAGLDAARLASAARAAGYFGGFSPGFMGGADGSYNIERNAPILQGGYPLQYFSNFQVPRGSAGLSTNNLAMPHGALNLNFNNATALSGALPPYTDSATRLRQEIAASDFPQQNAAAAYLDFLTRRQQAASAMAQVQQQLLLHEQQRLLQEQQQHFQQQNALNDPLWDAYRLASLTRGRAPGLLDFTGSQDNFARAAAAKSAGAFFHGIGLADTQANDSVAPNVQPFSSERAEATRLLRANELAPVRISDAGMLRTYQEGKTEDTKEASKEVVAADDPYFLDLAWDDLVADSTLTAPELRGVVSDIHFAVMAQMKPCTLQHEDRVGLYKTREIGFPGLACTHCGGVPGFGRYFPGSLTSLVNGNICKSVIKHLRDECRKCPSPVRNSILKLERQDELVPFHYRRGSRRRFFSCVWSKIHETQGIVGDAADGAESVTSAGGEGTGVAKVPSDDSDDAIPWTKILENSEVVNMSDRHLVPDTIFAATAQTKPCQVTEGDRVGRCKDHKLGSMGLCCKHCDGKPGAYGRYFPSNLHTFAQVEVCKQIVKHITNKCHACPPEIRNAILELQAKEKMKQMKRYPSRMVFFRRVWSRFQGEEGESGSEDGKPGADMTAPNIPWDNLVKDSMLVTLNDRGLISDSQFVAIAQMNRCQLAEEDMIGYNKNREIGFVGMCCRYCGGRPNFGRYFPNTVRNFEKTSARDTIVSHISLFCQECPEVVRSAMLAIKRVESSREGSTTMKGLIYGSGKLFFRRVWSRLHSEKAGSETSDTKPAAKGDSPSLPRTCKDDSDSSSQGDDGSDDSGSEGSIPQGKRKSNPSASSQPAEKRRKKSDSGAMKRTQSKSGEPAEGNVKLSNAFELLPNVSTIRNSMLLREPYSLKAVRTGFSAKPSAGAEILYAARALLHQNHEGIAL